MAAFRIATPLLAALAALFVAAPAPAATQLMPGVTYEFGIEFTPHGPVALHVVSAPRPTGLYDAQAGPVQRKKTVVGTERVTSMERRLASFGTMVGVNGDFWEWATGRPSGVLMRDNVVVSPPASARSSVGVRTDGTLDIRRVALAATWRGTAGRGCSTR